MFAQNNDCGYTLEPPSNKYTQSMFWINNKKNSIPLYTPILLYKNGLKGGRGYIARICYPDVITCTCIPLQQTISGKGIDRHLLGLKLTAIENNIDIPEQQNIFLDPAYSISGTWKVSTSQVQ